MIQLSAENVDGCCKHLQNCILVYSVFPHWKIVCIKLYEHHLLVHMWQSIIKGCVLVWQVHNSSALLSALYMCMQPVATVILASIFLKERFPALTLTCMFVIIGGILMVIYARNKEAKKVREVTSGLCSYKNRFQYMQTCNGYV